MHSLLSCSDVSSGGIPVVILSVVVVVVVGKELLSANVKRVLFQPETRTCETYLFQRLGCADNQTEHLGSGPCNLLEGRDRRHWFRVQQCNRLPDRATVGLSRRTCPVLFCLGSFSNRLRSRNTYT